MNTFRSPLRRSIAELLTAGFPPAEIRKMLVESGAAHDGPALAATISIVRRFLGLPPFFSRNTYRPLDGADYFAKAAPAYGCTPTELQARVIAVIAQDNLISAVLGEPGEDKTETAPEKRAKRRAPQ